MIPCSRCLLIASIICSFNGVAISSPLVLTGELRSEDAESIFAPLSNHSPVVLRYYAPEGARVEPGDPLVRIDPGQALAQIDQLESQIDQARARADKEIAELQVKALDAELARVDAEATEKKASLDAELPKQFLSALDYDRYQGEKARAQRELELKQKEEASAKAAVQRRRKDSALEIDRMKAELTLRRAQVGAAEQKATRAGVVVHGMDPRTGNRLDEGSSAFMGARIGEVVGDGALSVRAWALEPDRADLETNKPVKVVFDAFPAQPVVGRIRTIGGAPDEKTEWGDGRYFQIDIALDENSLSLRPGMSARVEIDVPDTGASPLPQATGTIEADGELVALDSAILSPPPIQGMWQFSITRLAPDGTTVKKDEVVVQFDGNQQQQKLMQKKAELAEKKTQQEQLRLELAEREKNEQVTLAQQRSDLDKAERKATQPEELLAGVAYRKLVIERDQARERERLSVQRSEAAAEQRHQEWKLISFEVEQLEGEVAELQASMLALSVKAPRDGVMMHLSNWQGEKYDVGSQVWVGQSVAEIPNPDSLVVEAQVEERDIARLKLGAKVQLHVEGSAGRVINGRLERIGQVVRSKSRTQPIPVIDVQIRLNGEATALKPGQPVRVQIEPDARKTATAIAGTRS